VHGLSWRRVVVAHNPVSDADDPSTRDVLDQVAFVVEGLRGLDLPFETVAVGGAADVRPLDPGAVLFNLVESPPGRPRAQIEVATAWEEAGVPFTGSAADVLWLTTDKVATRELLAAAGLPVAPGAVVDPELDGSLDGVPPPWILKPAWEDASLGLEGDPLCRTPVEVRQRAEALGRRFPGQPLLAEHFLPGREFNLTVLEDAGGARVLPVAEMRYVDFPASEPRVLGYEAKWNTDSFAYGHTVRAFPDPAGEGEMLAELERLALGAWGECGVRGYARVDLRLDEQGDPAILEINANPCLSGDAGFVAATAHGGLGPAEVVGRILAAAARS